ncbi:MAG: DUF1667 domain-containing protein [Spirochaetales bacterium]|nr:DUF1667 domain-containing protein [Spirochaetales bacterium]
MKDPKKIICISCPIGCELTVGYENDQLSVSGNKCARGKSYGQEEYLEPKRIVTAVVKTNSATLTYIPIKTDQPLKKEYINDLLNHLYQLEVKVPITLNQCLLKNFNNTGVNIVFTRSLEA